MIIEHDESQQNFLIIISIYLYNNDLQQTPSSSIIRTYRKKFTRINQIFFSINGQTNHQTLYGAI